MNLPPVAVLCHPHPAHGGTMHDKVVHRIGRGLLESGIAVLRFNFRGVGLSAGEHTGGPGEREDIRAALDWVAARNPGADILMAGFSFGAWNGLAVGAADPRVTRFVAAGLPIRTHPPKPFAGNGRPLLVLHGENDALCTPAQAQRFGRDWDGPAEVDLVRGADHGFEPHLSVVTEEVRRWLAGAATSSSRWV